MNYIYDSNKLNEILAALSDDDTVQMSASDFRQLALQLNRKNVGRKPISFDEDLFETTLHRWLNGDITAREAMRIVGLKPNTFYRRVKERKVNLNEIRDDIINVAEAVVTKAEERISAHHMEHELRKEIISSE